MWTLNVGECNDLGTLDDMRTIASIKGAEGQPLNILCVSDTHIGVPGDAANDFNISGKAFVDYLEGRLSSDVHAIILVGDVLEMWEVSSLATKPAQRLERLKKGMKELFKFLDEHINKDVFYIAGNHDGSTGKLMNNPLGLLMSAPDSGAKLFATHGHFVDEDNSGSGEWKGKLGTAFRAAAERLINPDIDVLLMKVADKVGRSGDSALYREWGEQLASTYGFDVVVMGHTHKKEVVVKDTYQYVNTGNGENMVRKGELDVTVISYAPKAGEHPFTIKQDVVRLGPGKNPQCCAVM